MTHEHTSQIQTHPGPAAEMHPLSLRIHPDPILHETCPPVEQFDSWLSGVLEEMFALMRIHRGVGLAAPQVGITQRFFVAVIQKRNIVLVNPVVITRGGSDLMIEGCLSLPGVHVNVQRAWEIQVEGFDVRGRRQTYSVEGLWARVMQHEIDHLNGVLICDKGHQGITVG